MLRWMGITRIYKKNPPAYSFFYFEAKDTLDLVLNQLKGLQLSNIEPDMGQLVIVYYQLH